MRKPKKPYLEAICQILRYMKSTIDYRIFYKKDMPCKIIGYCDVDYIGGHYTRHSIIGYILTLGLGAIS